MLKFEVDLFCIKKLNVKYKGIDFLVEIGGVFSMM